MNLRKAAVAGSFYPSSKKEVEDIIGRLFSSPSVSGLEPAEGMIGFVSPHAGYIYSGKTAAYGYSRIKKIGKDSTFVILGPNHYGFGAEVSIYPKGEWETPLGRAVIDEDFINELCKVCNGDILMDASAHLYEHSIEVQLPFLQYLFGKNFKFVPICMLNQSISIAKEISEILYATYLKMHKKGEKVFFISSSDFSHYVPKKKAEQDDSFAIEKIKSLDVKSFYETIGKRQISICGYGPISTLMFISKKLEVREINLLNYSTSADATMDENAVVGYASIEFLK
ncbi:MAG: MEMO1 family protein [Candidatus Micrarchaeota archaeon]|nr:MEMO1 family protein [Candidatus Micrarchaeota archaeon]